MKTSNFIIPVFLLVILLTMCHKKTDTFDNPYKVEILNDHDVKFVSKTDSLIISVENSGIFSDEQVVFIKK